MLKCLKYTESFTLASTFFARAFFHCFAISIFMALPFFLKMFQNFAIISYSLLLLEVSKLCSSELIINLMNYLFHSRFFKNILHKDL